VVIKAIARSVGTGVNETIDESAKAALRQRTELLAQYPGMRAALLDLPTTIPTVMRQINVSSS
jgi:hypothetical protein